MKRTLSTLFGLAVLCLFAEAHAVPTTVSFTGRLTTSTGPVNGNVSITFTLFNQATNGTSMWSENRPSLMANLGLVYADLGSLTTLDDSVLGNSALYLEIQVGSEVLTPRLQLQSVPYAIRSETANSADTLGTIAPGDVVLTVSPAANGGVNAMRSGNTVTVGLTTCAANQILKAGSGGSWACAADADTNTTYSAAANSGVVLNTTAFGLMTCSNGQVLKAGATAGTWACGADNDANTTYTAAANSGVVLNTTAFGLMTCTNGQVLKAGATAGTWACANDTDTTTTYTGTAPITVSGTTIGLASSGVTATHIAAGAVGMDEAALPIGTHSASSAVAAATGVTFFFASTTFTPATTGSCFVTAYIETSESTPSGSGYLYIGKREGASDSVWGNNTYLTAGYGSTTYAATLSTVVPVTAGQATTFGCRLWLNSGNFVGNSFSCNASYVCT